MCEAILYIAVAKTMYKLNGYNVFVSSKQNTFCAFSCKIFCGLWEKYELSCDHGGDNEISKSLKKKI